MQMDSTGLNSRISPSSTLQSSVQRSPALPTVKAASTELKSAGGNVSISLEARQRLAIEQSSLRVEDGELVGLEDSGPPLGLQNRINSAESLQDQQQVLRELAQRDREVRNHERTHASVGGLYTSAPSYTYERGPDGRLYAVSGEVKIDTSPIPNDPEATLQKAEIIQRAALAVADPSAADRNAAAKAAVMAAEARAEIARQGAESAEKVSPAEQEAESVQAERSEAETDESKDEAVLEQQQEFNQRLAEVSAKLAELNRKLFDSGAIQQGLTTGGLLDLQA